jgi:uncharacterized membrane protein YgdD (TMEM256/DUF423 family)
MVKLFAVLGGVLGFLGVAFGAFGAHALQGRLSTADLDTFEIGVRYQMYHAAALILTALVLDRWPGATGTWAGWAFVGGTLVFSGSLYLLVLVGPRTWGAVTPLGGVGLLIGWLLLSTHFFRSI